VIAVPDLAGITARLSAATGEWSQPRRDDQGHLVVVAGRSAGTEEILRVSRDGVPASDEDVEFIARARHDLERLMASLRGEMRLSDRELDAIAERCARASPGPWLASLEREGGIGGPNVITVSMDDDEPDLYLWRGGDWTSWDRLADDADFEFVAAARQDIPDLLAALRGPQR
jgi:hypothetical protein